MSIKDGDFAYIKMVVVGDNTGSEKVIRVQNSAGEHHVFSRADVHHFEQRPIVAGDFVEWCDDEHNYEGRVVAIDNGYAWIYTPHTDPFRSHEEVDLGRLTRKQ
jgi:hypothetical protein